MSGHGTYRRGYTQGDRTTANLYVTLLQLAGSDRESFGMPDAGLRDLDQHGPLTELLASPSGDILDTARASMSGRRSSAPPAPPSRARLPSLRLLDR